MNKNNQSKKDSRSYDEGELYARLSNGKKTAAKTGLHSLLIEKNRTALIYVPRGYQSEKPAFAMMLHGAGAFDAVRPDRTGHSRHSFAKRRARLAHGNEEPECPPRRFF